MKNNVRIHLMEYGSGTPSINPYAKNPVGTGHGRGLSSPIKNPAADSKVIAYINRLKGPENQYATSHWYWFQGRSGTKTKPTIPDNLGPIRAKQIRTYIEGAYR
jgi:hypothetical protein